MPACWRADAGAVQPRKHTTHGLPAAAAAASTAAATSAAGGLLTSTVLSLLVIPVVFTYLDDIGQWSVRLWRRLRGGAAAAASAAP